MAIELRPPLNVSGHSMFLFSDGTNLGTDTVPTLGGLPGQITQVQMPTNIGAGTSWQGFDIGTF